MNGCPVFLYERVHIKVQGKASMRFLSARLCSGGSRGAGAQQRHRHQQLWRHRGEPRRGGDLPHTKGLCGQPASLRGLHLLQYSPVRSFNTLSSLPCVLGPTLPISDGNQTLHSRPEEGKRPMFLLQWEVAFYIQIRILIRNIKSKMRLYFEPTPKITPSSKSCRFWASSFIRAREVLFHPSYVIFEFLPFSSTDECKTTIASKCYLFFWLCVVAVSWKKILETKTHNCHVVFSTSMFSLVNNVSWPQTSLDLLCPDFNAPPRPATRGAARPRRTRAMWVLQFVGTGNGNAVFKVAPVPIYLGTVIRVSSTRSMLVR